MILLFSLLRMHSTTHTQWKRRSNPHINTYNINRIKSNENLWALPSCFPPPPSILIFSLNYIAHMQFQLRYWISILIACFVDSRINIERQEKFKVFYLTMRVMTVLLLLLFFFYLSHSFTSLPSFLTFLLYAYLNCGSILCIFCQCNTVNGFFLSSFRLNCFHHLRLI